MTYESYYEAYRKKGFYFRKSLLTTYCLSLFTKPFVILSGISGTGKTKIAQLFNEPALSAIPRSAPAARPAPPPGQWVTMTVTTAAMGQDGRVNFKFSDLGALLSQNEIDAFEPRIQELKDARNDGNIGDLFPIVIDGLAGETLNIKAYLQRARNPLLRVRLKSKRGEPFYDATGYFRKHHKVGDVVKFERVADHHLRVVSVNDNDMVAEAALLEAEEASETVNTLLLSVRSDWTDSSFLFGYYNLIDQRYHMTPFLAFMLKARENPSIPFFLILDEMNLSKVEHYFSDFLSSLETRYLTDSGLIQEPIRLQAGLGALETDDDYFDQIPAEISIPLNFFVTGTVNVDESTYMFSSKVLDRANVIEFNDVELFGYAGNDVESLGDTFLLESFPDFSKYTIATRDDYVALSEATRKIIEAVHATLSLYQLQFGYRTVNEISRFLKNAATYCNLSVDEMSVAIDFQLLQKVLPKLHGSQGKLDLPLRHLLKVLVTSDSSLPAFSLEEVEAINPALTMFPQTISKLRRMFDSLTRNGFATFVE